MTVTDHTCHTCQATGRSGCPVCVQFEVELWDAIGRYATAVGGRPDLHVYGNTLRMQAVVDVNQLIARRTVELERDYAHLRRLYAGSRDYVRTLERERDDLVAASSRDVAEINRLDAEIEALRGRLVVSPGEDR